MRLSFLSECTPHYLFSKGWKKVKWFFFFSCPIPVQFLPPQCVFSVLPTAFLDISFASITPCRSYVLPKWKTINCNSRFTKVVRLLIGKHRGMFAIILYVSNTKALVMVSPCKSSIMQFRYSHDFIVIILFFCTFGHRPHDTMTDVAFPKRRRRREKTQQWFRVVY